MSLLSGLRLWIEINDDALLRETYEKFKSYDEIEVLFFPSEEEVRRTLKEAGRRSVIVVAPYPPPSYLKGYFSHKREVALLSSQDEAYLSLLKGEERKREEKEIIKSKVSLTVHEVGNLTLKDLKGMKRLKRAVEEIKEGLRRPELRPKAVFLVGIPGTGKSYSAKCVAGELSRKLVEFNLSLLMEKENPVRALHDTFSLFEKLPPSIVWIDEIDKIFNEDAVSERIKGQLLTLLEEFNGEFGYKGDVLFWLTANNIEKIAQKNPEFFRRFDYKFYVRNPSLLEAWEMFNYYFSKFKVNFPMSKEEFNSLYSYFLSIGHKDLTEALTSGVLIKEGERLFPFTPAEIKKISEKVARRALAEKREVDRELFLEYLKKEKPVVVAFKKAIDKMNEQAEMFEEV